MAGLNELAISPSGFEMGKPFDGFALTGIMH